MSHLFLAFAHDPVVAHLWNNTIDNALHEAKIPNIPVGYPSSPIDYASFQLQDGAKAARVLGFEYRSLSTQAVDTIVAIRARWPDVEQQLGATQA